MESYVGVRAVVNKTGIYRKSHQIFRIVKQNYEDITKS